MAVSTNAAAVPDADLAGSLVVTVTYDSRAFLDISRETPAQLSENVKAHLAGQPGKRVYLKGDARAPYSTIVNVLGALHSAGVDAPILLTSQDSSNSASYRPPVGLEVLLPPAPDAARAVTLRPGGRQAPDAELKQQAREEIPIVLDADGMTPFGDVVHAVDVFRGEGARVFLAMQAN
jgi:biopolymer transport protein ExbD